MQSTRALLPARFIAALDLAADAPTSEMRENMRFNCLICGKLLNEKSSAEEHIIPNALGGLLTSRHATCLDCNSKTGHSDDSILIKYFEPFLAAFDVYRSRGNVQSFEFIDKASGKAYVLKPGKKAIKAPNFSLIRTDFRARVEVCATSEVEARRLFTKYTKQSGDQLQHIGISENETSYAWHLDIPLFAPELLRGITRMAVYFARSQGLPIDRNSPAVKFILNEQSHLNVITPARGDVIEMAGMAEREVSHGVFLHSFPGNCYYAYVVLFEFIEYVVFLGPSSELGSPSGHRVNLISGRKVQPQFTWTASLAKIGKWLRRPRLCSERVVTRFQPVKYFLENRLLLWMERAKLRASEVYLEELDRGATVELAEAGGLRVAKEILERYNVEFDQLEFGNASLMK